MIINFNAKKAFCVFDITPALKQRFETFISNLAIQILSDMDYSNLETITVTDNFVDDVLSFQHKYLNGVIGVTNNKHGRAFGKMIYVPTEETYHIFLDSEYASFLIDDSFMSNLHFSEHDEKLLNCVVIQRNCAMNLFAHELEHYKFANIQKSPVMDNSFVSQCRKLMFEIFDEYNASRKSTEKFSTSAFSYIEEYVLKIEQDIMIQRLKYNKREISLDTFVSLFHQLTRQVLMYVAVIISSNLVCNKNEVIFENCRCHILIKELELEFDSLYSLLQSGEQIVISQQLVEWLIKYYELFNVYISETDEGLYYDIPYSL